MSAVEPDELQDRPLQEWAARAGITYRQANFWVVKGYIDARFYDHGGNFISEESPGQGYRCHLPLEEGRVLQLTARLTRVGIRARQAAQLARQLLLSDRAHMGAGVYLTVEEEVVEAVILCECGGREEHAWDLATCDAEGYAPEERESESGRA